MATVEDATWMLAGFPATAKTDQEVPFVCFVVPGVQISGKIGSVGYFLGCVVLGIYVFYFSVNFYVLFLPPATPLTPSPVSLYRC